MTASARLLSLRLHGFKSFAERTAVEFGPGISAVVGPNGSGKSNLADALRWALGEQGRALRTRKSEDVIFAGSEKRSALGMADVTLVLDNADALLPVEFGQVELGRRLYRSGENEYLLNRQRIRLRDLVDLLDGAHLADNAFLFIGQGMVDQALALRPEERRPLFEEVAGVRRHERRRRRAEEQLVESEANLARVEDIVAELRPQVRRLSIQAEQQATRLTAGDELAAAVLLAAHARWYEAAGRAATAAAARSEARAEADTAMAALAAAEEAVAGLAAGLGARAIVAAERREAHETARLRLTELQLRDARLTSELEAADRDRSRAVAEREAGEADLASQRRASAVPVPARDLDGEAALAEAERALAEAVAELAGLRAARQAQGEQLAALRRAAAARQAEEETARRRVAEAERRATDERAAEAAATSRRVRLESDLEDARTALAEATAREAEAIAAREAARVMLDTAEAGRAASAERLAAAAETLAALRGRAEALTARLSEDDARGIARAARRRGGRRVDDELVVDPALQAAVEAALGELVRAYLVSGDQITELAAERGMLVVADRLSSAAPTDRERRVIERAVALGGGPLAEAVRRDQSDAVRSLLGRAIWLPDLDAALALQPDLPPGWIAVTRDGGAVVSQVAVAVGRPDGILDRRAEADRLATEIARTDQTLAELRLAADGSAAESEHARGALAAAREVEAQATSVRRQAEDAERSAGRAAEAALREASWHVAAADRLDGEAERARAGMSAFAPSHDDGVTPTISADRTVLDDEAPALATWEARAGELRDRRDRLAGQVAEIDAARRDAEARRMRAETTISLGEDRIARAERDLASLSEADARIRAEREGLGSELAIAREAEVRARAASSELLTADAADRDRLAAAERDAASARERLRASDERARQSDVAELEARLGVDGIREGLLVELAGLGEPGLRALTAVAGLPLEPGASPEPGVPGPADDLAPVTSADAVAVAESSETDESADAARLEALLDAVAPVLAAAPPVESPPSPGRLGALRRRYHELGAANPYAVEEHVELRARLESLETQAADLGTAIASTRSLIEELNTLIARQFRATFEALEAAFDRRFQQLFGGGFARLALTDPTDLAATGVEIVARPPGKKAQNLAMLSGGERALTAVALLFSMLEVRPVPFCVLDEVDAALDEANVGRFTDALRGLAEHTQFVIITHNRGTIEQADALYGVTVGDDSVSRVISLRLEEAQAIADRARRDDAVSVG